MQELGTLPFGTRFLWEGEVFMRIQEVGVKSLVTLAEGVKAHKVLAVSMENFDLIVLDRYMDVRLPEE
tara:strand:- start:11717 stop:11920 length:204 start_codon:yes stop_codon:yes gene_type:complete